MTTLAYFVRLGKRVFYDADAITARHGITPLVAASLVATSGGVHPDSDFPDQGFEQLVPQLTRYLVNGGSHSKEEAPFTEREAHMLIFARFLYATGQITDDDRPVEGE